MRRRPSVNLGLPPELALLALSRMAVDATFLQTHSPFLRHISSTFSCSVHEQFIRMLPLRRIAA